MVLPNNPSRDLIYSELADSTYRNGGLDLNHLKEIYSYITGTDGSGYSRDWFGGKGTPEISNLSATGGDGEITVDFTLDNNGGLECVFIVQYWEDTDDETPSVWYQQVLGSSLAEGSQSFSFSANLENNTTYEVRVTAYNAFNNYTTDIPAPRAVSGSWEWTNTDTATVQQPALSTPTIITATVEDFNTDIYLELSTNGNQDNFDVQYRVNSGTIKTPTRQCSSSLNGLNPEIITETDQFLQQSNDSVEVRVRATGSGYSDSNWTSWTICSYGTVPSSCGVPAPIIESINSGDGKMFVYNSIDPSVTGIQYRLNGGAWSSTMATGSPLEILVTNGNYDVELRAEENGSYSPASNLVAGEAEQRDDLDVYLLVDRELHSSTGKSSNIEFKVGRASSDEYLFDLEEKSFETANNFDPFTVVGVMEVPSGASTNYRMYYSIRGGFSGVATSTDLINWTKPALNLPNAPITDSGNNILQVKQGGTWLSEYHLQSIIYVDSISKYIAVFDDLPSHNKADLFIGESTDGYTFTIQTSKAFTELAADGTYNIMYDEGHSKPWVIYGRKRDGGISPCGPPDPIKDKRDVTISRTENYTDSEWSIKNSVIIDSGDVWDYNDSSLGNIPLLKPDIYNFGSTPYEDQYIGIFTAFMRDDNRIPVTPYGDRTASDPPCYVNGRPDRTDGEIYTMLAYSRDGEVWDFPTRENMATEYDPIISLTPYERSSQNPDALVTTPEVGSIYSCGNIVKTNTDVFIFFKVNDHTHYEYWAGGNSRGSHERTQYFACQKLPVDRFGRFRTTDSNEGTFRTGRHQVKSNATSLTVNASITGSLKIEVLNSITGDPIQGFEKSNCTTITGDSNNHTVNWSGKSISDIESQNVRLKFHLTDGSVYSWKYF